MEELVQRPSIITRIANRVSTMIEERSSLRESIRHLKKDLRAGNLHRTGYVDHYTEDAEVKVWERYRLNFQSAEESEPAFRAKYVRDQIRQFIPAGSVVLNFGCSYGWLEGQLDDYRMIGIDRSEITAQRNRNEFPTARFLSGDVEEFLESNRIDVFCHINVGTYFLPTRISRLYSLARKAGAKYIVAFEPSGISHQTRKYFDYSTEHRETVVFRGQMLLNNYPGLMSRHGYKLVKHEILKPPHPHKDFRSAFFLGYCGNDNSASTSGAAVPGFGTTAAT